AVSDTAVVTTGPGEIAVLLPSSGRVLWSILGPDRRNYTRPAVANGMAFVTSYVDTSSSHDSYSYCCAYLSAFDLFSGGELAAIPTESSPFTPQPEVDYPIVSGGTVYVNGSNSGMALRPSGS
ncbi:MAG: hypothetical protein JOZ99_07375, partial [Actinobacteria bacterium]|nr:hypothetical protein [Actinomycetota bacterium]